MAKKNTVRKSRLPKQCSICGEIFYEEPYIVDGQDMICGRCHFEMQMGARARPKEGNTKDERVHT